MKTEDDPQLELFSEIRGEDATRRRSGGSFFWYLRGYEKALFAVIGFFIVAIAAFSIGVEKGKRIVTSQGTLSITAQTQNMVKPQVQPLVSVPTVESRPLTQASKVAKLQEMPVTLPAQGAGQRYTIQIASYKSVKNAQDEAAIWRKKGYSAMTIAKGSYTILCVGNFTSLEAANALLAELKKQKRYADSRIRRL